MHWPRVDARRLYDRYVIHALTHARNLSLRKRVNVCTRSKRRNVGVLLRTVHRREYDEFCTFGIVGRTLYAISRGISSGKLCYPGRISNTNSVVVETHKYGTFFKFHRCIRTMQVQFSYASGDKSLDAAEFLW